MYGIIIIAIFLTRIQQDWFNLPDCKPFNCAPCLTFWNGVTIMAAYILGLYFFSELIINFEFIYNVVLTLAATYLAAEILIIYESK